MSAKELLSSMLICLSMIVVCSLAGGFIGGRLFTPDSAMGWDAIANMLGGLMIGGIVGAIAAIFILRRLKNNHS